MLFEPTIINHGRGVSLIVINPPTGVVTSNIFITRDRYISDVGYIDAEDIETESSIVLYVKNFPTEIGHVPEEYDQAFIDKLQEALGVRFTDTDSKGCPIVYNRLSGSLEEKILRKNS